MSSCTWPLAVVVRRVRDGPRPGIRCVLPRGDDVDVEFVAFRVGHAAPLEAFEIMRGARLQPPPAQRLDFGGHYVEVLDNEV